MITATFTLSTKAEQAKLQASLTKQAAGWLAACRKQDKVATLPSDLARLCDKAVLLRNAQAWLVECNLAGATPQVDRFAKQAVCGR